jgi:hypothetical protein
MSKKIHQRPPNCPAWIGFDPSGGPSVTIHAEAALAWAEGLSCEEFGLAIQQIHQALLVGDYQAVAKYPFVVTSAAELDHAGGSQ